MPPSTYLGFDVFDAFVPRTALGQNITNQYGLRGDVWQKQSKVAPENTERILDFTDIQIDNAERKALRDFFILKQGRNVAFWVLSKNNDYRTSIAGTGATPFIEVQNEFAFQSLAVTKRHLYIPHLDQFVEALSCDIVGTNTRIGIAPSLSGDLPAGSAVQNTFLVRFNDDTLEFDVNRLQVDPPSTSVRLVFRELQGETPDNS